MGNIQNDKAREIAEKWQGGKCTHEVLYKEYYLGTATGDYVCGCCGASGLGRDWPERNGNPQS